MSASSDSRSLAADAPPTGEHLLDPAKLPRHVGIIMDGNGRWATARGKARAEGHLEGVKAAKRVVAAAVEAGLPFLSLYTFSTENWARAEEEVSYLMFLVRSYLRKEYDFYRRNAIRIVHSGNLETASARHRAGDPGRHARHRPFHRPHGQPLDQLRRPGRDHQGFPPVPGGGSGGGAHGRVFPRLP